MTTQKGSGHRSKKKSTQNGSGSKKNSTQKGSAYLGEKQLAGQLRNVGNELLQFPTDQVHQLLSLLGKLGNLLMSVDQCPSELIQKAYSQCMEALVAEPLLRHTDADVQVAVAFCINDFLRITAPNAPYSDDKLKEAFKLTVSSFENLSDISSRSYDRRASILETVHKVRSWVIMLDLECNALISEMFQHFLSSIREFHPEQIFISMESIMTHVLEESDDDSLSLELLTHILANLQRNNEEISTSARKLGENVLAKCAVKLKPYLKQAVESLGLPLDGYNEIVAKICNESSVEVEYNSGNVSLQKEKPEAAELVNKLFGHDEAIVVIDKNDRAAHETALPASKRRRHLTTENIQTQINNTASGDNAPASGTKSQRESETTTSKRESEISSVEVEHNSGNVSLQKEKPEAAELVNKLFGHDEAIVAIDKNDRAADGISMLASKRRRGLTTEDIQTQIHNTASGDNAPASGTKSLTTTSKRATISKNNDEQSSKLEETIGILAVALDEIAMPASKRRRNLTTKDIQTEIDNTALVDNAPASGTKSQSQSKTTTSKRTTNSKNDDEQSSKLKETVGVLAGALKDMIDDKKLPIPIDELWDFIHQMKLDEDLAGDAFVFLLERPLQLKGLIYTPIGIRKSILLKMMMRDAK